MAAVAGGGVLEVVVGSPEGGVYGLPEIPVPADGPGAPVQPGKHNTISNSRSVNSNSFGILSRFANFQPH